VVSSRTFGVAVVVLPLWSIATLAQVGVFRASIEAVVVDVAVHDGTTPVSGLTAADFELLDSGVPQAIVDITHEALPIDATLVIDLSQSVRASSLQALANAVAQIRASLRSSDGSTVIAFDERIREPVPGSSTSNWGPRHMGLTSLWDAIAMALPALPQSGRRSMLIVFSDGYDTSSFLAPSTVLEMARRASAAVFTVALRPASTEASNEQDDEFFTELADLTGGRFTRVTSETDVERAFLDALEQFRASYVLRYMPKGVSARGWHGITVKVTRPGRYTVRARRGYTR
jgi:hypothetical protein